MIAESIGVDYQTKGKNGGGDLSAHGSHARCRPSSCSVTSGSTRLDLVAAATTWASGSRGGRVGASMGASGRGGGCKGLVGG